MEQTNHRVLHPKQQRGQWKMRKLSTSLICVILVSGLLLSLSTVNSGILESFTVPCSSIRLSVENYKKEGGRTPVFLSLGELELSLWLDKEGWVSERKEDNPHLLPPLFIIDFNTRQIRFAGEYFPFFIYEQNRVRTRLRLIEKEIPVYLELSRPAKEVHIFVGENRLPLSRISGQIKTADSGGKELWLTGAAVHTRIGFDSKKMTRKTSVSAPEQNDSGDIHRVSGAISSSEREALITLYNKTDGDNWTNNSGWKTPPLEADGFGSIGSENNWYGITCSAANTRVEEIRLPGNNLQGTIPVKIGGLSNLNYLNLNGNLLSGLIPAELGGLSSISSLFLNDNQLTGSIPAALGNLKQLTNLFLSSNQLTGSIPQQLGNLTNLRSLRLNSNQLTGSIPAQLGNLSKLLYLYLSGNQLKGDIPGELGELTGLVSLLLNSNRLTGTIPPELGNLINLVYLCLDSNDMAGGIPPEFGNLETLALLQLQDNRLEPALPQELGLLENLEYLYLNGNKLLGLVPGSLTCLTALIDADISYNALFTHSKKLREFLNSKNPGWESTQTVAPARLTAYPIANNSILLTWTPISYTGDTGRYKVYFSPTSGLPYKLSGDTEDKRVSQMTVTGLNRNTKYYFVVKTRTEPHDRNKNAVISELTFEVSAKTKNANNVTVSGVIKEPEGKGVPNVTLSFSNFGGSTASNGSGFYSHEVVEGWSGIVKPAKTDYFFSPAGKSYSNVVSNRDREDYTAIYRMIRDFQVRREEEKSWIIKREFAVIDAAVKHPEYADTFIIYRKQPGEDYRLVHQFFPTDFQEGNYTYNDTFVDRGKSFTYKLAALNSAGTVIATSGEQTI